MTPSLERDRIDVILASLHGTNRDFDPRPVWTGQPLHTAYVSAEVMDDDVIAMWRSAAVEAVELRGGVTSVAQIAGISDIGGEIADLVRRKLVTQPIEDLRVDYEDGYGYRDDVEEDADAARGGAAAARVLLADDGPDRIGLRIKPLDTRAGRRGLRTLDVFLNAFLSVPGARERLSSLRITLAKVMASAQVAALAAMCDELEKQHGLRRGILQIEIQVEVPHLFAPVRPSDSLAAVADHSRVSALHFGTYDFTSAQGVFPGEQRSSHPVALHAKRSMQVVAAALGIEVCDGSSNLVPAGARSVQDHAWRTHAGLVGEAMRDGIPQGWDMHPAQLPTRYLAAFAALRVECVPALARLRAALAPGDADSTQTVLDEPATVRMLAAVLLRAARVGAYSDDAITRVVSLEWLAVLARTGAVPTRDTSEAQL